MDGALNTLEYGFALKPMPYRAFPRANVLPLPGQTSALHLTECLHATQKRSGAQNGYGDQDMAQRHAAVVQKVHDLDADDGPEEGRVGQGSRAEGLGKLAEVGAEEAEPLRDDINNLFADSTTCADGERTYEEHQDR